MLRVLHRSPHIVGTGASIAAGLTAPIRVAAASSLVAINASVCSSSAWLRPSRVLLAPSNRRKKHIHKLRSDNELNPLSKPTVIDPRVLYVVSVPIGNLKDFTLRALDVLRACDYIICADRTNTRAFLDLIDVDHAGRLIQLNHQAKDSQALIDLVKSGSSVAFVVSQGTPCVGDAGGRVIRDMMSAGIRVSAVPGVDACTTALTMSGANTSVDGGAFRFGSYLSNKRGQRLTELRIAAHCTHPSVYFESGKRLLDTLADIAVVAPRRRVAVMHEMTKLYESTHADRVEKLIRYYQRGSAQRLLTKGQICLVIDGTLPSSSSESSPSNAFAAGKMAAPARSGGMLQGVDGDAGRPAQQEGGAAASNSAAWHQGLQDGFVHYAVCRCIARTGQSVVEACQSVSLALRLPLAHVTQAYHKSEAEEAAALATEDEAAREVVLREAAAAAEASMNEDGADAQEAAPSSAKVDAEDDEGLAVETHAMTAATSSMLNYYGDTSREVQRQARKDAAARFLALRASLRANAEAKERRQREAMTRPSTGNIEDHMPSDWVQEESPGADDSPTRADHVQRLHDAAAAPPQEGVGAGSDGTAAADAPSATAKASGKSPAAKRGLKRRLALMRKVDQQKEHVRLLQMSLLSRESGGTKSQ